MLFYSILGASQVGYRDRYGLLTNNCATKSLDALDSAIKPPSGVAPFRGNLWNFHDEIEKPALEELTLRKINYTRVFDMNSEVQCAQPGENLGRIYVDKTSVGSATALCKLINEID